MHNVRFKTTLCIALFLTSALLVYNAFSTTNSWSFSRKTIQTKASDSRTGSFADIQRYSRSVATQISNDRVSSELASSLPQVSCVRAFTLQNGNFSDQPFASLNPDSALIPASTNKYLTAAIVLGTFDLNETLDTQLLSVSKGPTLDIAYLKSTADPSYVTTKTLAPRRPEYLSPRNTRTFENFAKEIKNAGVKKISRLVLDVSWFDLNQVEDGWKEDQNVVGKISAFNIDEGFEGVELSSEPNSTALNSLIGFLNQEKIDVGKIELGSIPENLGSSEIVAKDKSPTFEVLVSDMLKTSDNVYAEQLLAASARTKFEVVDVKNRKDFAQQKLKELGIDVSKINYVNGSGYTRDAKLSCQNLLDIQDAMKKKNIDLASMASIAGIDGTLKIRFDQFSGKLKAKTGTLDNVTALSGELDGKMVFSFISNSTFSLEGGQEIQESVVEILSKYPYVQEPDF